MIHYKRLRNVGRIPLSREEINSLRWEPWNGAEQIEQLKFQLLDLIDSINDFVLAPHEPTEAMIKKGTMFQGEPVYMPSEVANIYKDMVSAVDQLSENPGQPDDCDVESLKQIIAQKKKQNADLYYQNSEMLRVLKYAAGQALSANFNAGNWIDMVIGLTTRIERGEI